MPLNGDIQSGIASLKEKTLSDLTALEEQYPKQLGSGEIRMSSKNPSLAVGRLAGLLFNDGRFTVMPELSLDMNLIDLAPYGLKAKDELVPDICLYSKEDNIDFSDLDELKVTQIPLLAIEVLSPRQGINEIIAKFHAYFALGIKSCWLVIPVTKSITIYSQPNQPKTFDINDDELVDEVTDIRLPTQKIFGSR
jgi:Uma2 family endonuclease